MRDGDNIRDHTAFDINDDDVGRLIRSAGPRPQPSPDHYARVLAASRAAWQAKVAARRRRRIWGYAVAASLALVGTAGVLYETLYVSTSAPIATAVVLRGDVAIFSAEQGAWQPLNDSEAAVYAGDSIRTAGAARAAFNLANGVSVRLNVDTQLAFTDAESMRLTAGAVYVDSNDSAAASTVRIETPFGSVRDIGTQFEVVSDRDALRLRIRSGRVEVLQAGGAETVSGGAGEQIEIEALGTVRRSAFPPAHEEWSWVQAMAAAPDLEYPTLLGYLRWIARETGRELRFDDSGTETRAEVERWLGDPEGLTPTEVLEAIVATTDFSYEFTSDGGLLVSY